MGDASVKVSDSAQAFYRWAYEGVEDLRRWPAGKLHRYRRLLLDKTRPQVAFIGQEFPGRKIRVIEFCSGNGRLLIALEEAGWLEFGYGIEIARSRIRFALDWQRERQARNIVQKQGDVLRVNHLPRQGFDLGVLITGAFQYFYPVSPMAPKKVLARFHQVLTRGGKILLELYPLSRQRSRLLKAGEGSLKIWEELPEADGFRFYLSDLAYHSRRRTLKHTKIFIGRDGSVDEGRVHWIRYYTAGEIRKLLTDSGFSQIRFFGDFQRSPYREGVSSVMAVVATRD